MIEPEIERAVERLGPSTAEIGAERPQLEVQIWAIGGEPERLTAEVVAGGELSTLMDAIKERETAREGCAAGPRFWPRKSR